MKKTVIVIIASVAVMVVSNNFVQAVEVGEAYDYVSKVHVGENNYLSINVKGNFKTTHGCSQRWYARSLRPLDDERTKAMMRVALSSFLGRKKVYVNTDGCRTNYPIMVSIQIQQD